MDPILNGLPPLPEGAKLDTPGAEAQLPPLPQGATLDAAQLDTTDIPLPELPPGATLDQQPMPGVGEAALQGLESAFRQQAQTAGVVQGQVPGTPEAPSPAAAPFEFGTLPDSGTASKIAYRLAESSPTIGAGMLAGTAGAEASGGNPYVALATGSMGAAGATAMQTLGPAFASELQKTPNDPNGAYDRAVQTTANSGAWSAVGWAAGIPFFKGPIKNILFQTFGVQPAVGGAQQATQNILEGKPVGENVPQAAGEAAVMGVPIVAGHAGVNKVLTGKFFPEPPVPGGKPGVEDNVPPPPDLPPLPDGAVLDAPQPAITRDWNQYEQAQQARRASKFQDGKIAKENDQQPPLTPQEQAYNDALLQQRDQPPEGGSPIIAKMRDAAVGREPPTPDRVDPVLPPAGVDAAETSPAFDEILRQIRNLVAEQPAAVEHQNAIDAKTPRYVFGDGTDNMLWNATDLEEHMALHGNMPQKPTIREVAPDSLEAGKISATIRDLPPANDRRVSLNGIDPQAYEQMRQLADFAAYHQMLDQGLRVVPSPGASHMYTGKFSAGEALARPPESTRFAGILHTDPEGNALLTVPGFGSSDPKYTQDFATIDSSRIDPQDLFGTRNAYNLLDPNGKLVETSDPAFTRFNEYAANRDLVGLRQMVKEGYRNAPYRGGEKKIHAAAGEVFLMVKPPKQSDIVPAYAPLSFDETSLRVAKTTPVGQEHTDIATLDQTPYDKLFHPMTPERVEMVGKTVEALKEVKPVVDAVLKELGAKNQIQFVVDTRAPNNGTSPFADVTHGYVVFPLDWWKIPGILSTGDVRSAVHQIVFHETGHIVSMRSWQGTKPDVQGLVRTAYNRARLRHNLRGDPASNNTLIDNLQAKDHLYYLTFAEWHAEQFRRWMNSADRPLSAIDRYFKNGLKDIQDVQATFDKKFGTSVKDQMFQSDWTFNTWMDYIESAARGGKSPLEFAKTLDNISVRPPPAGALENAYTEVAAAVAELRRVIRADVGVSLEPGTHPDGVGFYDPNERLIRIMLGSMAWVSEGDLPLASRLIVLHEAWHGVEDILTPEQNRLMFETAKREKLLDQQTGAQYYRYFYDYAIRRGDSREAAISYARGKVRSEFRAKLIERMWSGWRYGEDTNKIFDTISNFVERVGNLLRGRGFQTAQDIVHAFYRGEITERFNRAQQREAGIVRVPAHLELPRSFLERAPQVRTAKGDVLHVQYFKDSVDGSERYTLYRLEPGAEKARRAGFLEVDRRGEISFIKADLKGRGVPEAMLAYAEKQRGEPFKTAQLLTQDGYNMIKRRAPDRVKYYVPDGNGFWMSPKAVWDRVDTVNRTLAEARQAKEDPQYIDHLAQRAADWKKIADKIPSTAKEDAVLQKQWALRRFSTDEWQKDAQVRGNKVSYQVTGAKQGRVESPYDQISRLNERKYSQNPLNVAPQAEMPALWGVFRRYGDANPNVRRQLHGTTRGTDRDSTYTLHLWGDKMISLGKSALMIRQLAWRNPHVPQLRDYVSLRDQQNQRTMQWIARADETARSWDNLREADRNAVSDMLFWATEMRYRTPQEVRNRVVRQPTAQELAAYAQQHGVSREAMQQYQRVNSDFAAFLSDMERVFADQINRRFAQSPQVLQTELAKLAADMVRLRQRPYFPMTRFGKFTLTARDPNTRAVRYFQLYQTPGERDAAVRRVHQMFGGLADVSISMVPEGVYDYMGLPGPLLDRIRDQLIPNTPGLTPAQISFQRDWLNRFSHLMSPENSFKKRWLERRGTPGYSLDGVRAYAQYFRSGSRYLSRIEFHDQINATMNDLDASVRRAADGTTRQIIADTVRSHAKWMDAPGKDWTKLKVLTTMWQLGFSPAAAMMNLTQVPTVTYPYLASLFGERALLDLGHQVARSGRRTLFTRSAIADPVLAAAHAEMVRQGRIDIGQAAELGTFADNSSVDRSWLGTQSQRALRVASYAAMWGFGKTERFNREWTFETAFKAALRDPNNRHVQELTAAKHRDWTDVIARTGMTGEQASAFLVAREAIDRTQGIYQSWDRPAFLRGKLGGASRIFFMYTQQMLFALHNNPGRLRTALILGALYGTMGLPGAEDIDALVHAIAVKVFGKDFSLKKAVREFVRGITKGTFLDEVGPDIALHGISRYGFGMSLLPDFMGWPQFDASGNGSMGQLVPGFADLMNGWANSGSDPKQWQDTTSRVLQDVAGPGLGQFFPWMQYMNSAPYGGDQAKWEAVMPRSLKALAKSYHMWADGGVRDKNGNLVAKMDPNDPEDRATIIAQGLGFSPRVANETYEQRQMMNDTKSFYAARKAELTADLYRSMRLKDTASANDVMARIKDYNADVLKEGLPEQAIKASSLVQGMRERLKNNQAAEQSIVLDKQQRELQGRYNDLFPGLIESRKVR